MEFSFHFPTLFRAVVLPPAGFFVLMAAGWLLGRRWPRCGRALTLSALTGLVVLSMPAGADLLVAPLENRTTPLTAPGAASAPVPGATLATAAGAEAQAIVVLAAGRLENAPEYAGTHIPDYVALARLRYAARLHHKTGLPILLSGANRSQDVARDSKAASMARALREDFQVPVRWLEEASETTAENALHSSRILRAEGISRILLVTDAMHMPRAEQVFRAAGLQVTAAPTMFFQLQRRAPDRFFPSAEGLRRSYYASYEWLGLWWYQMQALNHRTEPHGPGN